MSGKFQIKDDAQYKPSLYSDLGRTDGDCANVVHLFRVRVFDPRTGYFHSPVYVLAQDAENAIQQAQCDRGLGALTNMGLDVCDKSAAGSNADEVPMLIRGWGGIKF